MSSSNPYVGLRPFRKDESMLFFGRREQTLELLKRLHSHHFVAVVGSSGSGKSSLIRAGLIPSLKGGFLVEDSDDWLIASMKPGQDPIQKLLASILNGLNLDSSEEIINELHEKLGEQGADAILDIIEPIKKEKDYNFFLLVDQFEELFRIALKQSDSKRRDEAFDFVNIILELSKQERIPFYVVITMRSDFVGDCDQFYSLPEAMNKSQFLVSKLNRTQLKRAIEGPVKLFGKNISESLTSFLVNELNQYKDGLPILQHALNRTWEVWEELSDADDQIGVEHYKKTGGMSGALDKHAEEAYAELENNRQREICQRMFKALTEVDIEGRRLRRPTSLGDLCNIIQASEEEVKGVIEVFRSPGRSFLMPPAENILTSEDYIDISHESLMRIWNRLITWMDEEEESVRTYRKLTDFARDYESDDDLAKGQFLQTILKWDDDQNPNEFWANLYNDQYQNVKVYLRKSREKWQKEEEKKQKIIESQFKAQRIAEERKRRNKWIGFFVVFIVSLAILGAIIISQQKKVKEFESLSKKNELLNEFARVRKFISYTNEKVDSLLAQEYKDTTEMLHNNMVAISNFNSAKYYMDTLKSKSNSQAIIGDEDLNSVYKNLQQDYLLTERLIKRQTAVTVGAKVHASILKTNKKLNEIRRKGSNDPTQLLRLNQSAILTFNTAKIHLNSLKSGSYDHFILNKEQSVREFKKLEPEYIKTDRLLRRQNKKTVDEDHAYYTYTLPSNLQDTIFDKRFINVIFPEKTDSRNFKVWSGNKNALNLIENQGTLKQLVFPNTSKNAMALFEDGTAGYWPIGREFKPVNLKLLNMDDEDSNSSLKILSIAPVKYDSIGYKTLSVTNQGMIVEWDLRGTIRNSVGKPVVYNHDQKYNPANVTSIAISRKRAKIFTANDRGRGMLWLADTSNVEIIDAIGFDLRQDIIMCSIFSNGDSIIATGSVDGTVKLWSIEGFKDSTDAVVIKPMKKLIGHKGPVTSVAFSVENKFLYTGSLDKTFRMWRLPEKEWDNWNPSIEPDSSFIMELLKTKTLDNADSP